MRMMMRAVMDTDMANRALKEGRLQSVMESVMGRFQPEAAYFFTEKGRRCCLLVFDMQDSSQLPQIAEPFFSEFGAEVEVEPAMNREDLQRGLASLS